MSKRVLILGGGIGGYVSAREIVRRANQIGADIKVQIIEKEGFHYMPPLFFDVALGYTVPEKTRAPIKAIENESISVIVDEVEGIDADNMKVKGKAGTYEYDYLVVALGTDQGWADYPGLAEEGYHNFTLDGAQKLREALLSVKEGQNITIAVPELPYRCGIYPYEIALVLPEFFKARDKKVSVRLLDPMPSPAAPHKVPYYK